MHGNNYSQIAQLAELRTVNPLVVGSSPTLGAMRLVNMDHLIGRHIVLVSCTDQYTKLTPGSKGVIKHIDDHGTVFVDWEDGSNLGLIPGVDKWKFSQ